MAQIIQSGPYIGSENVIAELERMDAEETEQSDDE